MLGGLCGFAGDVFAQPMVDPKQMSGIPRPVGPNELPNGSVSVRLIRGDLANNIAGHPIELTVDGKTQTVNTDDQGRAQFDKLPTGATVRAVAVVDGERLESQEFPAPAQGGIRLMLVATDKDKEKRQAAQAAAPAVAGTVTLGGQSRIVIEPGDERIALYYILEVMNPAQVPVNPAGPLQFDMPTGALGTAVLQGSSPLASSTGAHVRILGPFPPGMTSVEIGAELPVTSGTMSLSQVFPTLFEQLVVVAKKEGAMGLSSPQLSRVQDTAIEGTPVLIGAGGPLQAGQPLSLTLSGLRHRSPVPRYVALTLASLIGAVGLVLVLRPGAVTSDASERKKLAARREKLLQDLARAEQDHRRGRIDAARYAERRETLIASLEHIYRALDTDDALSPA
jgi:hypothetical protein